jgi:DNA primase
MKFSQEFIERVQESNNLVDIISQYTQLKPAAGGYMGRCPFPDHPEKTPSFSVSDGKQVYNCFGCHKKGNVFTFLQEMRGMNFRESIEWLADRAQISLPEPSPEEGIKAERYDELTKKKKEILKINRLAAQYFHDQFLALPQNHPVVQYAKSKRGLSQETLKEFQIGYASEEWDGLTKFLQSKNVNLLLAEEAKLIKPRKEGKSGHYDFFRERLMFPVLNVMNEVVAFGGRVVGQGEPKYLNSQETAAFHKTKVLYGLSSTARFIRSEDVAMVVEGYMDLVSLFQSGIPNVVATMGTAMTGDHAKLLSRMTKNIVVLFDGDSAGISAAERSLPILLAAGLFPKGLILPDGQDPDDFVKNNGAEVLKNNISNSSDLFSMILNLWIEGYKGEASEKIQIADRLKSIFSVIQDQRLTKLYISEAASKLRVDVPWLTQAVGLQIQNQHQKPASFVKAFPKQASLTRSAVKLDDSANRPNPDVKLPIEKNSEVSEGQISLAGLSKSERTLIYLVLKNRAHIDQCLKSNLFADSSIHLHSGVKSLLEKAAATYRLSPEKFDKLVGLLASFVDKPEFLISAPDFLAGNQIAATNDDEVFKREELLLQDCIRRISADSLKIQADKLAAEIKTNPTSEKMEKYSELIRTRKAIMGNELG